MARKPRIHYPGTLYTGTQYNVILRGNARQDIFFDAESEPVKKPEIDTIIEVVERLYHLKNGYLAVAGQGIRIARARSMAAWAVLELSDAALTDLAKKLGPDVTTLSSSVRRLLERSRKDDCLAKEMERLREIIDKFATLQA